MVFAYIANSLATRNLKGIEFAKLKVNGNEIVNMKEYT